MNTLRELAKKLPMHLRAKWTEQAGNIIEEGRKPEFEDFRKFIQRRAKLVNNEFGSDMVTVRRDQRVIEMGGTGNERMKATTPIEFLRSQLDQEVNTTGVVQD